jgi:putative oxidoreductase
MHMNTLTQARTPIVTSAVGQSPVAAIAGRALIAAIFVLSGLNKIADPTSALGYIQSAGLPLPRVALGLAISVEILGGIALVIGFRARFVAAVLAAFSVVTAIAFHRELADPNQFIQFFKNVAIAGGLLQIVANGPGRLSLDERA